MIVKVKEIKTISFKIFINNERGIENIMEINKEKLLVIGFLVILID